jgi:hypothetical protein
VTAARVRITDLIDADAASPRYCGHSIGRVIETQRDGAAAYIHVRRVERIGNDVWGVGVVINQHSSAAKLQMLWDVRWGLRIAPPPPAPDKPGRLASMKRFADVDGAAAAIVAAGYRELSKRHHPDVGGDHMAMSLLTQAKTQLVKILALAKEGVA